MKQMVLLVRKAVDRKHDVSQEQREPKGAVGAGRWTVSAHAKPAAAVYDLGVAHIRVDPSRFQFKHEGINPTTGVNDELKKIRTWNRDMAGVVLVWMDPANKQTYIVNGHHRYDLAKRLRVRDLTVRYVDAPTAEKAMIVGALCNLAEGRGTTIDAAKLMRTNGISEKELVAAGVSLSGFIADQASGLANLCPRIWADVVAERMTAGRGAIIGHTFKTPTEQEALAGMLNRPEVKRKRLSDAAIMELAKFIQTSGRHKSTISTLFGEESLERSLAVEKAQISAAVKAKLLQDKRLFGFVASQSRADVLKRAGNKLEVERNREISQEAERIVDVYDRLCNMKGTIATALSAGANDIAKGKPFGALVEKVYDDVRRAVGEVIGGGKKQPDTERRQDASGYEEPQWADDDQTGGLF